MRKFFQKMWMYLSLGMLVLVALAIIAGMFWLDKVRFGCGDW